MWERSAPDDPRRGARRTARALTLGAAALFWMIATAWRPWRLFERAGFSADFYDEQARSFLRARLHVDPTVAGVEGFLIGDLTYLYYGPLLAVARLPTALIDTLFGSRSFDGRLALASMLLAIVVLGTWSFRLLATVGRVVAVADSGDDSGDDSGRIPAGPWRTALFVGAVLGSPVLFLAGWISVYHETELWACTFAVIAATCMLELLDRRHDRREPSTRWLVGAGAATIACVLTRASVGFGVALALVVVGVALWRLDRRATVWAASAAAVGVGTHMALNLAKFGSLLGLPAERQVLSLLDPERAAWFAGNGGSFFSLRFLPTTLVQYLRPDAIRFERLVPGWRFGPLAPDLGSYPVETITPASSITLTAPVLMALAVIGVVWLVRQRRWSIVGVAIALGVGAVPSVAIGFVANRYLVDLLPLLIFPAAFGVHLLRPPARPGVTRGVVIAALIWGTWVNAALGTWALGLKSPGFTETRYRIDSVLFPAPSPGLVTIRPGLPIPRDGVVGVEPDCSGVYVAEQGTWVALERAEGRRILTGTVLEGGEVPDGAEVMVAGPEWTISLVEPGADASLRLTLGDAEVALLPAGRLESDDQITVVADPVTREFFVSTPEQIVFFDPSIPGPDDPLVGVDLAGASGGGGSLCSLLTERR